MFDFLITALLVLLALLMAGRLVWMWTKTRNHWLWFPFAFFLFAGFEFVLSWGNGLLSFLFALVAELIIVRVTGKKQRS